MPKGVYKNPKKRARKISRALSGRKLLSEHCRKISEARKGNSSGMLGKKASKKTRQKISKALKGKMPKNFIEMQKKGWEENKGRKVSKETRKKLREASVRRKEKYGFINSPEARQKLSESMQGNNNGYKGDKCITPENIRIRQSIDYRLWREAVFVRDNFTCQKYGTKGGILRAHHIKNFADFPELRFAIDNGITLSKKAHKEFHKRYGIKNNTREQLEEFLLEEEEKKEVK